MTNATGRCPDCQVEPGAAHQDGCDVARCRTCGWQRLNHNGHRKGFGAVWTGEWPGLEDVQRLGLRDLNELASLSAQGFFQWSKKSQRWDVPS